MSEPNVVSVTEATRRGVAGLVKDAESGGDVIVSRHGNPVAAVVAMAHFQEMAEAISDLREAALILSRAVTDTGDRVGLDEVLAEFGLDRTELQSELDDESQAEADCPPARLP